jgi:hypothetical protein
LDWLLEGRPARALTVSSARPRIEWPRARTNRGDCPRELAEAIFAAIDRRDEAVVRSLTHPEMAMAGGDTIGSRESDASALWSMPPALPLEAEKGVLPLHRRRWSRERPLESGASLSRELADARRRAVNPGPPRPSIASVAAQVLKRVSVSVASDQDAAIANDNPSNRVFELRVSGSDAEYERMVRNTTSLEVKDSIVIFADPFRLSAGRLFFSAPDDEVEIWVEAFDRLFADITTRRANADSEKERKSEEWRRQRDDDAAQRRELQERLDNLPPPP